MSFGWSVSDVLGLGQLAFKVVQNSRRACGEHDELTCEVAALNVVLQRFEQEISKSNSPINFPGDSSAEELQKLAQDCRKVLRVLNLVLEKYNALDEKQRSGRRLWQKIKFGNGEMSDLADLRSKVLFYTSAISFYLNMINMGTLGRVEEQINTAGGVIKEIQVAVNKITIQAVVGGAREGSILTTYSSDDKSVWKKFRRELINEGFSSTDLQKHKQIIQAYVKELGSRGLLDDEIPDLQATEEAAENDTQSTTDEENPLVNYSSSADCSNIKQIAINPADSDLQSSGSPLQPSEPLTMSIENTLIGKWMSFQYELPVPPHVRCIYCGKDAGVLPVCLPCKHYLCFACEKAATQNAVSESEYKPPICPCGEEFLPSMSWHDFKLPDAFWRDYNTKLKVFCFATEREIVCQNTECGRRIPVENIHFTHTRHSLDYSRKRVLGECRECGHPTCCLCEWSGSIKSKHGGCVMASLAPRVFNHDYLPIWEEEG